MDEQNMAAIPEEEDVMMPDGYGTGDDFFADEWTGQDADAQPEPEQEAEPEEPKEDAPTTEQPEEDHEAQEPETETPEDAPRRLRFKARVDREDMDVDIGEDEVPTLYQLAKAGERWKAKNDSMSQQMEHYVQMAKGMGYATVDEMIAKTAESYKNTKVQELVEQGTPQTIAEDYVDRMMQREAAKTPNPEPEPEPEHHERDIQAEAKELIVARPDLKMQQLPAEVVDAWRSGDNLLNAYNRYEARQKEAENQKLKKENNILKQNAAAAAKAPVKGVSGGAPTDTEPEDPFLKGFDSDPW